MATAMLVMDEKMAKKKTVAATTRPNPRMMGIQDLTVSQMRSLVADCRFELAEIDQLLDRADSAEITTVTLNGATKLARGLELLQLFSTNLHRGVKETIRRKTKPTDEA